MAMVAVGFPAEPEILDPELKKLELANRFRRPIGDTFFKDEWGKPVN